MLELYRRAISCRREYLLDDDELEMLEGFGSDVVAYRRRSGVVCIVNMGSTPIPLPDGEVILVSDPVTDVIPADTAVWMMLADDRDH